MTASIFFLFFFLEISLIETQKNADPIDTSNEPTEDQIMQTDEKSNPNLIDDKSSGATGVSTGIHQQNNPPKSLKDAVKPKNKRKKNREGGAK